MTQDNPNRIRLISFVVCPFVQRAVVALREKGVAHEVDYIDLKHKPDWFLRISPRGKVPVLVVDEHAIFESVAICEYLDEVYPTPRLLPDDPLSRARDRGWFQFAEDLLLPGYRRMFATDSDRFDEAGEDLTRALSRLEQELEGREYLSGDGTRFGMADLAIVPAFTKLDVLRQLGGYDIPAELARVRRWSERLLTRQSVVGSVRDDYVDVTLRGMKERGALLVQRVGRA